MCITYLVCPLGPIPMVFVDTVVLPDPFAEMFTGSDLSPTETSPSLFSQRPDWSVPGTGMLTVPGIIVIL